MSRPASLVPSMLCVKNLLLGLNCIFVITGMMLITVGSCIKGILSNFNDVMSNDLISPATFLIVTGAIVFAVALFGCVGAVRESTCLINLYTLCLIVIFVFEFAAGIAGFVMQSTATQTISRNFNDAIHNKYLNNDSVTDAVDFIQREFHCCGANSPEDWTGVLDGESYGLVEGEVIVPDSCCGSWINKTESGPECENPFVVGCLPAITTYVRESAVFLTVVAMTVALIQALGIYFSNELAKGIREAKSLRTLRQMQIREQLVSSYRPMNKSEPTSPTPVVYLAGMTEDTTA